MPMKRSAKKASKKKHAQRAFCPDDGCVADPPRYDAPPPPPPAEAPKATVPTSACCKRSRLLMFIARSLSSSPDLWTLEADGRTLIAMHDKYNVLVRSRGPFRCEVWRSHTKIGLGPLEALRMRRLIKRAAVLKVHKELLGW